MNKQKGFSAVEGLLIVLILCVVGFAGYTVWNNNQEENSVDNDTSQSQTDDLTANNKNEASDKAPAKLIISLDGWSESSEESTTGETHYSQKEGSGSLVVYDKNPRIFYSSNAPVYCQLDGEEWTNYSDFDGQGYTVDTSSDSCESVTEVKVGQLDGYEEYGGALGQIKYSVALLVENKWYVFTDYENHIGEPGTNTEISGKEIEVIKSDLRDRVQAFLADTIK